MAGSIAPGIITKSPTCTDYLQPYRIVVGILNGAIIEPFDQCFVCVDADHYGKMVSATHQITDLH